MLVIYLEYGHGHIKNKIAAFVDTLRFYTYLSSTGLHYLSDNSETKADTIAIDLRSAVQLTKLLEDLLEVFSSDAYASIQDVHYQVLGLIIEVNF